MSFLVLSIIPNGFPVATMAKNTKLLKFKTVVSHFHFQTIFICVRYRGF